MARARIYIRRSDDDQSGYSPEAQDRESRRWCDQHDHEVVEVYTDPSGPASGADYRKCAAFPRGQSIPLEVAARRFQIQVNDLLP